MLVLETLSCPTFERSVIIVQLPDIQTEPHWARSTVFSKLPVRLARTTYRHFDRSLLLSGAFDDAEVTHVEGDVDPCRDMSIIQNELRLKDAEWVEKTLTALKKAFRGTGNASLAEKAKKQEIETVEKALKALTEENKDIRKVDWTNKEVGAHFLPCSPNLVPSPLST